MTTIAVDNRSIAADGLSAFGREIFRTDKQKLIVKYGRIYAMAGEVAARAAIIEWHNNGADPATVPLPGMDWNLLVVDLDGIRLYGNNTPYPTEIKPPFALGSGDAYAIGAMEAGATPREAVEIAAKRNTHTGGQIVSLDISKALLPVPMMADVA
jgi:ATP-dependent protease HslVU (ClpYQ) peptidase subunit